MRIISIKHQTSNVIVSMIWNISNLNKYNNKHGNSKVPQILSICAYDYNNSGLGKPNFNKNTTVEDNKKMKRNSTGNLY